VIGSMPRQTIKIEKAISISSNKIDAKNSVNNII
jgi:hypothetical protein